MDIRQVLPQWGWRVRCVLDRIAALADRRLHIGCRGNCKVQCYEKIYWTAMVVLIVSTYAMPWFKHSVLNPLLFLYGVNMRDTTRDNIN